MTKIDFFERKLDDKNRLTIPADVRAEFADGEVVITQGFGEYLHLYSKHVWDADMESALSGDILDERIADLNVKFRFGKQISQLDKKQGRITIDQRLLDHGGLTSDVVAVRVGKYWRLMRPDIASSDAPNG